MVADPETGPAGCDHGVWEAGTWVDRFFGTARVVVTCVLGPGGDVSEFVVETGRGSLP